MHRRHALLTLLSSAALLAAPIRLPAARARADLYRCDGCAALREHDPVALGPHCRIGVPAGGEALRIEGLVYQADGRTPAADVVLYAYHTDGDGLYTGDPGGHPHGRLRGWLRTGADGRYRIDTGKPAPYPGGGMPAHVHLLVGEPGRPTYYIDDVVFAGETGVDARYLARQERRGGSGVVSLARGDDGVWLARRDIVLEVHPG
jgi:protocatechuate 3,4-dioxygenase, beta subunit